MTNRALDADRAARAPKSLPRTQALAPWAAPVGLAVAVLVAGIALLGVGNGLARVGIGLAIAGIALAVAQQIRRRWTSRAPEAERRATTILFGAGQRDELTRSLRIEVDQVVRNLKSFHAKFLGKTVMAMLQEYEEARESSDRQAALLNVVMLMEKLQAHFSPGTFVTRMRSPLASPWSALSPVWPGSSADSWVGDILLSSRYALMHADHAAGR